MLIFLTSSAQKFSEFSAVIPECRQLDIDLEEIQGTPEEIVVDKIHKAKNEASFVDDVLVDDVAFYIRALGGFPGPYAKWFHQTVSPSEIYGMVSSIGIYSATAVCMFGYHSRRLGTMLIEGRCEGAIVTPSPEDAYGFDGIFMPSRIVGRVDGCQVFSEVLGVPKRFSEMTVEEKNQHSHRGAALRALSKIMNEE